MEIQQPNKLYEVFITVEKDQGYCYKGQMIQDVVSAPDEEVAIDKVLRSNMIDLDHVLKPRVKEFHIE